MEVHCCSNLIVYTTCTCTTVIKIPLYDSIGHLSVVCKVIFVDAIKLLGVVWILCYCQGSEWLSCVERGWIIGALGKKETSGVNEKPIAIMSLNHSEMYLCLCVPNLKEHLKPPEAETTTAYPFLILWLVLSMIARDSCYLLL